MTLMPEIALMRVKIARLIARGQMDPALLVQAARTIARLMAVQQQLQR
jgi:hypothetical protein